MNLPTGHVVHRAIAAFEIGMEESAGHHRISRGHHWPAYRDQLHRDLHSAFLWQTPKDDVETDTGYADCGAAALVG